MSDADLLDALDRRAARAVADLDALVDRTVVPPLDLERGAPALVRASTSRWREPRLLAAAAAILAVAVVAAVLVLQQREERTPVAVTPGEPRRLILPPDLAAEYDTVVATQGGVGDVPLEIRLHAPEGAEEPWPVVVAEHVIPSEDTTLDGDPVDIGVATATYEEDPGSVDRIGWEEDGVVRYLASAGLSRDELVALARATVEEATPVGDPLPGHDLLYRGTPADVYTALYAAYAPADLGTVAYANEDAERYFVVVTSLASPERWRAAYAIASSWEPIEVRGVDAVLAHYGEDFLEVSWIEGGDTLVRVAERTPHGATATARSALLALVEQLVEAGDEEWRVLVGRTSASMEGESSEEFDGQGEPVTPTTLLTLEDHPEGWGWRPSTSLITPDVEARAWIEELADGTRQLGYEVATDGSGTAGAIVGADTSAPLALREQFAGGTLIVGLIGPDVDQVAGLELRDADGRPVDALDAAPTAVASGTSLWLLLLYTAVDVGDEPLSVVARSTSGAEIVVAVD